ncbi:transglycosylase SLT domain-containing protein [Pseudoalteromonas sp. S16_S37]|uniref:transglycosylase SLT domain-containing protein n=1 Tax=Pseudoalteromonas sp. S16_S37 TaxID=2720228 RepID=UPI001680C766|nr:transglycosylase SLT domain-containing protein [Pseudoalteromonas sp. S16_S37]MBD1581310.1 DUF3393 domain-containing protein [Pseudoalteromonas sp. S16_S37]
MKKKITMFAFISQFFLLGAEASQDIMFSELDEAMQQWQSNFSENSNLNSQQNKELEEFELFKQQRIKEFDDYVAQHFAEFDAYRDNLIAKWGEAEISDKAKYVAYNDDNDARLIVDFEANTLSIAVHHSKQTEVTAEDAHAIFARFLSEHTKLFKKFYVDSKPQFPSPTKLSTSTYDVSNVVKAQSLLSAKKQIKAQTIQQQQLIEHQMDDQLTHSVDTIEAKKLLEEKQRKLKALQTQRLERLKNNIKLLAQEPKSAAKVTEFAITLPKSIELPRRAKEYEPLVSANSERFGIESSLVFSVIHTESHFNPLAKSAIPAFGLMQVVPTSAGVDVNRFLYNRDEPMAGPYLYNADNNIEAGAAYLHILDKRYLKHITDPLSRKYCMIAAYNTGAGNVARVFNSDDSRNIKNASRIINSMTPERVLEALERGLPYDETKHYLKRVLEREQLYQSI